MFRLRRVGLRPCISPVKTLHAEMPWNQHLPKWANKRPTIVDVKSRQLRSSYEKGCQGEKYLPAPLRDAGVVTYIQPHLIPYLILRGGIGLFALARRTSPRRCQPQLLVPTRRFHEVS